MADLIQCPTCGATDQEVGKFCEKCGGKVEVTAPDAPVTPTVSVPTDALPAQKSPAMRFIRLENGVFNRDHAFDVPVGATLLLGRTDPLNGIFPEVDITMWSKRVQTPEGALYTVHRKQCVVSRDQEGRVWIKDYPDYVGDTLVSPAGTTQFQTISALTGERDSNAEGAVALQSGDRILMGQGEGMLIFQLLDV